MVELVRKPQHPGPTAQQLADDRDRSIELQLVMQGKFDKEIAALKALKAELDVKIQIANTLDAAQAVKAQADDYAVSKRAEADKAAARADEALAAAEHERDEATVERAQVVGAAAKEVGEIVEKARREADGLIEVAVHENAALAKSLEQRKADLEKVEDSIGAAREELAAVEAAVATRKNEIAAAFGLKV